MKLHLYTNQSTFNRSKMEKKTKKYRFTFLVEDKAKIIEENLQQVDKVSHCLAMIHVNAVISVTTPI